MNIKTHNCSKSKYKSCLLYTSDAADERSSVDLGGRRIIKKKKHRNSIGSQEMNTKKHIIDTKQKYERKYTQKRE